MGQELELKLVFGDPAQLDAVLETPVIAALADGSPRTKRLRSVYFDTPDHSLAGEHVAVRVRYLDHQRVQTVKARAENGSVYARGEWETPVEGDRPDPGLVPEPGMRALLEDTASEWTAVFETDFKRTMLELRLPHDTEIELAVDRGVVRAGERTAPILEAELELKQGSVAALFDLARRLHDAIPFRLELRSKAARGYALHGDTGAPQPASSAPLELSPDATADDVFNAIARACVTHMIGNELCALDGRNARGVHQMRVGSRRLRSAVSLFRKRLNDEWIRLSGELRWLARRLGPAREWDVFLAETLEPLQKKAGGLKRLKRASLEARDVAYERVRETLSSPRYTRLVLDLGRALERPALKKGADRSGHDVAVAILEKRRKRLCRAAKRYEGRDAEWWHSLRIRFKKLRYAAEFFQSLFDHPRRAHRFIGSIKKLQDAIGRTNDVATTPALLGGLPGHLERARKSVAGWQKAREGEAQRHIPALLEAFRKVQPFWR